MQSFFRYPGGKSKLRNIISQHLNLYANKTDLEYREPFFGGGSIGLKFITDNPGWKRIWINDVDSGIASLWTAVIRYPDQLKERVREFRPSVEKFYQCKEYLLDSDRYSELNVVDHGFRKLAIHQISYSGLGTMSGGPLGGRAQKSAYGIDCRWSPDYICKKIDTIHEKISKLEIRCSMCTDFDFIVPIDGAGDAILYLDPPYYVKGNELYQHGFTVKDHERLARYLRNSQNPWILSYDDCPEVRKLYDWAIIENLSAKYSIKSKRNNMKGELLIYPKSHTEMFNGLRKILS